MEAPPDPDIDKLRETLRTYGPQQFENRTGINIDEFREAMRAAARLVENNTYTVTVDKGFMCFVCGEAPETIEVNDTIAHMVCRTCGEAYEVHMSFKAAP
jgi:DeoR/GlpR family transcriptional regulator of sugar metabolism